MRRKDREVTNIQEIEDIIQQCKTCHVAMVDGDMPYVVPLSFGYEIKEGVLNLYFHSAKEGRKMDILHKNNQVCFEMCREGEPVFAAETPCNSGYYFSSVHGFGKVAFIQDVQEKCHALSLLMKQQAHMEVEFTKEQADAVCVYKIATKDFVGKRKPLKTVEKKNEEL